MDGIIVINKPAGMTSHDVIAFLRKKYKQKKFGHTGTLDPNASGVLVVLCGKACKILQFLEDTDKEYIAQLQLGAQYSTDDIGGEKKKDQPIQPIQDLQALLRSMEGKQHQLVPKTSAKKIQGKKLMDYQREGKEVPDVYANIEIYATKVLDEKNLIFQVSCSSGTYIRSICRDIAQKTNNLGAMASLVRTKVGRFQLEQAESLDQERHTLYPLEMALDQYPFIRYPDLSAIKNGKPIMLDSEKDRVCLVDQEQKALAIYEREEGNLFKSKRGLW